MARQPPLVLTCTNQWHQQALAEIFVSYFPEGVFEGFHFPYVEDIVSLPAFNRYAEWAEFLLDAQGRLPRWGRYQQGQQEEQKESS